MQLRLSKAPSKNLPRELPRELPKKLFPFIWHFLHSKKAIVSVFIALAIIAGFWGPFNSILIKNVIDLLPQLEQGSDLSSLLLACILIVLNFIIFDNFTWRGIGYIRCKHTPVIINKIISHLTDYTLRKSHQFFQDNLSGKISKQITNLADSVEKIIADIVPNFLRGASLLIMGFVAAYFVSPIFCWILFIWFVFFVTLSLVMSNKLADLSDKQAFTESLVVGQVVDSISNQSNIRLFSRKIYEKARMLPFLEDQQRAYHDTYFYSLIMQAIQGGLIAIMMAASCYFLVDLYSKDMVSIGDFALIIGLSMETGHMMWYTMWYVDEFNKAVGKSNQALNALITPLEIQDKENADILQCHKGQIIFDKVGFHYKGTNPLFDNKSVEIQSGQKVGLVGYSGSGKSSFVNLIMRLYDVTSGAILIDGQDIKNVTQDSLRESISIIPQEPSLFHRSLIDNIRYGNISSSDEEVMEASRKAHAHEFIMALPEGYNALVGERGVKLSGGQRQRIAIARAILKNSPILILDEATSQLDSVTENLIQESLLNLMQDKTTIVIAHRLSTLLQMDRIIVFDKGVIVEDGRHKDILARQGLYKELWDAQLGGFLGDDSVPLS